MAVFIIAVRRLSSDYSARGCLDEVTHLYEREQEAHGEVGQPVYGAGDHEGSRPVGLFKQLPGQDEGDTAWQRQERRLHSHLLSFLGLRKDPLFHQYLCS